MQLNMFNKERKNFHKSKSYATKFSSGGYSSYTEKTKYCKTHFNKLTKNLHGC